MGARASSPGKGGVITWTEHTKEFGLLGPLTETERLSAEILRFLVVRGLRPSPLVPPACSV